MLKLLLTGASGHIGRTFFEASAERYEFRLTDRRAPEYDVRPPHRFQEADLADRDAAADLVRGIDTVVHLAADPRPDAPFDSLLPNNILATTWLMEAAAEAGCRRFVFASSGQTMEGYPLDRQFTPHTQIRPGNLYGVSKAYGEALCGCFAARWGLSTVAVRIGAFQETGSGGIKNARDMSMWLSPRDCVHLLQRAVEAEGIDYFIAHGVSDNRFKRLDISETRRVLGYDPQDDAFAVFDVPIEPL